MKKLAAITGVFVAFILLSANQAEAQHFHRGYGPGWGGGSGFNISIGNGAAFGPGFNRAYGPAFYGGWNQGFAQPGFYRPAPIYAAGYRYGGFNRGADNYNGRSYRPGCGW